MSMHKTRTSLSSNSSDSISHNALVRFLRNRLVDLSWTPPPLSILVPALLAGRKGFYPRWPFNFLILPTLEMVDSAADESMYGPPVDLSFKDISRLTDAWALEPNRGLRPLKRNSEMKYLSCSLRLNNNNIIDLRDLPRTINNFLAEPLHLAWLDLSFNNITHIDEVLCQLQELRLLYLHGNSICILSEVDMLGTLPHLHSITLHGNVIETEKNYRNHVISVLPQLKSIDFSAVTRNERDLAKIWHHSTNH